MSLDGRIIIMGMLTIVFWSLSATGQRRDTHSPRIEVPRFLAAVTGSKTRYVIWRDLSIQIGFLFHLLLYTSFILGLGRANLTFTILVSFLLMIAIQFCDPSKTRRRQ